MLRDSRSAPLAASARWQSMLQGYGTTDLAAAAETAKTNRVDTKFVLHADELFAVLAALEDDFRVLDVDGARFTPYRTQYFDTESFALFRRHHAGGGNRYKVRTRTYLNTALSFIEVKRKTKNGTTSKLRLRTDDFQTELLQDAKTFVDANCAHGSAGMRPSLRNSFDRICLVSVVRPERLTIDLDIAMETEGGRISLPKIAVVELKQEKLTQGRRNSGFLNAMRRINVRPMGFSKYCMGLLLTRPDIKHNLFKPQLKRLRRLTGEPNVDC
jgi:hypothetical protein